MGPVIDESATVMALEGVQKKVEVGDNCENSVYSLPVHKKGLAFDGREESNYESDKELKVS